MDKGAADPDAGESELKDGAEQMEPLVVVETGDIYGLAGEVFATVGAADGEITGRAAGCRVDDNGRSDDGAELFELGQEFGADVIQAAAAATG